MEQRLKPRPSVLLSQTNRASETCPRLLAEPPAETLRDHVTRLFYFLHVNIGVLVTVSSRTETHGKQTLSGKL